MIYLMLFLVAIAVGIGVSMDVSGYNLSMAGDKKYSSKPVGNSLMHAFWHALFLGIGIGLVEIFAKFSAMILVKFDLLWLFSWVSEIFPWMEPIQVPVWILAVVGVALWGKLYWDKIRAEGDEEIVPGWLMWVLNLLKVPAKQLAYVIVAVDMWFLTPLLKTVIEGYDPTGKLAFVVIVFAVVFACSYVSIKYGQRLLETKHKKTLFYWMVTLVWAEPLTTGYFAARATWWSITGILEHNGLFFVLAGACVVLLCTGKFRAIVEDKWEEANKAFSPLPQTA